MGSQAIARDYKNRGVAVKAFLQLDMTAYFAPGTTEVISLMTDYVESGTMTFIKQLISQYSRLSYAEDSPVRCFLCAFHPRISDRCG